MTLRGITQDNDQSRLRAGLLVLMVGLGVLLAAVAMAIMRSPGQAPSRPAPDTRVAESILSGVAVPILAITGGTLVIVLLVISYALFRITRNLAVPAKPPPRKEPTPTDDVWQQHKLPGEGFDPQEQSPDED